MTVKRNLVPNPACAVDAAGWVPTPAGSYVRSTSVDAALPRTTGLEGTVIADINSPRYQVTPGDQVVISVSVKALAVQANVGLIPNFYDAPSGGTFVGAGTTSYMNLAAGAVERYVLGPITVPVGAVSGHLKFNDIDTGGVEITALRATVFSGDLEDDGTYYDGASAGWAWDGTAGSSSSSQRVAADEFAFSDDFDMSVFADPNSKVFADPISVGDDTFSILASGTVTDVFRLTDGFLVASLAFDAQRGRVRLDAYTFAEEVSHAVISRRVLGGKFVMIRGGNIPTQNGHMTRVADDYEYPPGVDVEYLIEGRTDQEMTVQRAVVRRSGAGDQNWLKVVANPRFNQRVKFTGWDEFKRRSRTGRFDVAGRTDPVFTTDVHSSRETTAYFLTRSRSETEQLDNALSTGLPIYLQIVNTDFPTTYWTIGDYSYDNPKKKNSGHMLFKVPLVEGSAPAASITSSLTTYQTIVEDYVTYNDLLNNFDSYGQLAS